ncbi:MAG: InlB B-repeat-containing protein [Treponema sp.]|nr:InlB B-repeat-containing protein [Candidatus Treponema equifaecale]
MKRKFIEILGILASFMLFFAGCSADSSGGNNGITVAVKSVTLNKETLSLKEGSNETLIATVNPDDASNKTVTWDSSDTGVATVDGNGKVVAIKKGTTTITVTAKANTKKTATCIVTVTESTSPTTYECQNCHNSYDTQEKADNCSKQAGCPKYEAPVQTYTVTFDLNGGSGTAPESITKTSGTAITLPTTSSTKTGYKFNGWAETNNATSGTTGTYTVSKNVTLYAVWIAENAKTYKVSFMNGTTVISSSNVPENTSVTKPTDPTKDGDYKFDGWYSDAALTTAFDFSSKIAAETKIYAKFTLNTYPTKVPVVLPTPSETASTPEITYETSGATVTFKTTATGTLTWKVMKGLSYVPTGTANDSEKSFTVDCSKLDAGTYTVHLTAGSETNTKTFTIN